MRKTLFTALLLTLFVLILPVLGLAQYQYPLHQYFAVDFAQWSLQGPGTNSFVFLPSQCLQPAPGVISFQPFSKTPTGSFAPVFILDTTAVQNNETVTPTQVTLTGSTCTLAVAPVNTHYSFQVMSATAGLQEGIDAIYQNSANASTIYLDKNWYTKVISIGGTAATIINSVKGSANIAIADETTAPFTYYLWNGTAYTAVSGAVGGTALPAVAAGAGAGTSPTIAGFGNGGTALVNLTAGSATATGSIFTLTYANSGAASNTFAYAPSCSIVSVGANVPAGTISVASTYASSHATVTASVATTALTAATAYQFRVSCQ